MRLWSAGIAVAVAAAGVLICLTGPDQALAAKAKVKTSTASADRPIVLSKFKKRQAHAGKKSRTAQSRHARNSASKAVPEKNSAKIAEQKSAAKEAPVASKPPLPAAVANARAEALADDEARNIAALDSTDVVSVKDGVQIAEADRLTDADRALSNTTAAQNSPPVAAPPEASAPAPSPKIIRATSPVERQAAKTGDEDPWNKTSLIGKIFIAFGSLLTLASAARLLIA